MAKLEELKHEKEERGRKEDKNRWWDSLIPKSRHLNFILIYSVRKRTGGSQPGGFCQHGTGIGRCDFRGREGEHQLASSALAAQRDMNRLLTIRHTMRSSRRRHYRRGRSAVNCCRLRSRCGPMDCDFLGASTVDRFDAPFISAPQTKASGANSHARHGKTKRIAVWVITDVDAVNGVRG